LAPAGLPVKEKETEAVFSPRGVGSRDAPGNPFASDNDSSVPPDTRHLNPFPPDSPGNPFSDDGDSVPDSPGNPFSSSAARGPVTPNNPFRSESTVSLDVFVTPEGRAMVEI